MGKANEAKARQNDGFSFNQQIRSFVLPPHPFSMTDEEGDLPAFHIYLTHLSPSELQEVLQYLDSDRYPRRAEAVEKEVARRNLFFVSPYTPLETRLRHLWGTCVGLGVLCVALGLVGNVPLRLLPGEKLPFFFDLAAGGPPAARLVFPLFRLLTLFLLAASVYGLFFAGLALRHNRLRTEVWWTGVICVTVAAVSVAYTTVARFGMIR
jgi:hypothetical protein